MNTATTPTSGLDPLLSIEELAEYLGVPITTIYDWRVDGKEPCGVRVGAPCEVHCQRRPGMDRRAARVSARAASRWAVI
jgi:Helix-turn-helix domain